jgi:hypothetical protein
MILGVISHWSQGLGKEKPRPIMHPAILAGVERNRWRRLLKEAGSYQEPQQSILVEWYPC